MTVNNKVVVCETKCLYINIWSGFSEALGSITHYNYERIDDKNKIYGTENTSDNTSKYKILASQQKRSNM